MTLTTEDMRVRLSEQPQLDISNEAYREYIYPNGDVLRVEGAIVLILEKKPGIAQDRHRLIIKTKDGEQGMYVVPGWLAIRWSTPDGKHGITW
jgi:hypothetical protein